MMGETYPTEATTQPREQAPEGRRTTSGIERLTARAPSPTWLWLAGASILGSLALFATGRREEGIFVGLWPLTFLVLGNYNRIVQHLEST